MSCANIPPGETAYQFNNICNEATHNNNNDKRNARVATKTKYMSNTYREVKKETFGNPMGQKKDGMIRIISQNIGCLGINSKSNPKQDTAIEWIHQNEIDVVGWQEVGISFDMLKGHESFYERIRDSRWKKRRVTQSNNIHEKNDAFQWGGTSLIAIDEAASRVSECTKDATGLGRWCTMLFEGKHKHKVRIVSAYNPCKTSDVEKLHTVYNQHRRYFNSIGKKNCPRLQFRMDLIRQINEWKSKGELIIILMDFNEDLLRNGPLQQALLECDLVDPIRQLHSNNGVIPPPTSKTGSTPIDSIFVSRPLQHIHKGGWLKLGKGVGDHRPLYIDIPVRVLFGEDKFKIHRHEMRRLKCDNPNLVKKFNQLLLKQLIHEKTHTKLATLRWNLQSGCLTKEECTKSLIKIDNSIQHSVLYAEKKCRKLCTGEVPFSIEAKEAGQLIHFWNNVIRKKRGWNISSKYIRRLAKKCHININQMKMSIEDCENERKLARMGYANVKKEAEMKRDQYIENLAALQASRGNESKSNAIKRMKRNEDLRSSYRRIKSVTKTFQGATERVKIPDRENSGKMKITTNKIEIEEAIREENEEKFKLAYKECPFLQEPLLSMIGQDSTTECADQILRGTFQVPQHLGKYTKRFIELLKMPDGIRRNFPINDVITPEQAKSYWRKKSEKTTSSYSGKHIGTYKASTHDLQLLNIQTSIVDLVYRLGITIPRWTIDLDVTLLKKPNRIRPQDMRTIGQLEADFNQGASIHFGQRMMMNALKHDEIPKSQYSKKGSRAIEGVIVKVLFFDYLRINKLNGAFSAMDLMQCFDRMAHPISALCSQRLGLSKNITSTMIKTISSMRHYIRTAYGDSDDYYGGDKISTILQGGIQGNGAASPIFIAISCVLLQFLQSFVQGFHIQTAITLTILSIAAIMYVDDTDLLVAAKSHHEPIQGVISRMQKSIKIWRQGVIQTGGALRPEKCKWFLISFKWKQGKWRYGTIAEDPAKMFLKNSDGQKHEIERLETNIGLTGLGVCIAPDGNQLDQVRCFMNETPGNEGKVATWIKQVGSKYLRPQDVHTSAFRSIFKSIDYVLPATSMSEAECKMIETKLYKTMLPKMGVARNIALSYRYAPKRYQGLGCMEIKIQQYCENVKMFLFHANTESQIGQSIKANMESLHLLIGVNKPLFEVSYKKYGFLSEKSWITNVWRMSCELGITLQGLYTRPHIVRDKDFSLMEKLVTSKKMTTKEMESVNRCRVYLQIQNMSDITNGMGTRVLQSYIDSKDPVCKSKYKWPHQPKPPPNDWKEWKRAVLEIWSANEQGILSQSLGPIICSSHQISDWTFSISKKKLYRSYSLNSFLAFTPRRRGYRGLPSYEPAHHCQQLPEDCKSVKVNNSNNINVFIESELPDTQINFDNDVDGDASFFRHVSVTHGTILQIVNMIRDGNALAASDGSVKQDIGTASWIITGDTSDESEYQGSHGVPPSVSNMTSHRAELYGIYAILQSLQKLEKTHTITNGHLKIVCDNKAALHCSFSFNHRAPVSSRNFDIIWAIYQIRQKLNTTISYKHVYGHADKLKRPLTWPETLNCRMDKKAKLFREYIFKTPSYQYSTLHLQNQWAIITNGKIVSQDIEATIKNEYYHHDMSEHLIVNKGYHPSAPSMINWNAIEAATRCLPLHRQIWATKFVSGFCGVAEKMKERDQWESNLCPLCMQQSENAMHVLLCRDHRALQKYQTLLQQLHEYLDNQLTNPDIIISIISTLSPINTDTFSYNLPPNPDFTCALAAQQQDIIGRNNMFKGHISTAWKDAQQQYLEFRDEEHSKSKAELWAKNLVSRMYLFSFEMWDHRNMIVHTRTEERLNKMESDALRTQIQKAYDQGDTDLRNAEKKLMKEGLQKTLAKPVREKKAWLASINASKRYKEKSQDNIYSNMRRNFLRWMSG